MEGTNKTTLLMSATEYIGPSVWHGREINSCTRCKYLKCVLTKSGRNPDYDYFCRHPKALSGELAKPHHEQLLKKVEMILPQNLAHFKKRVADDLADCAINGEFISNDDVTPETPDWCPVIKERQ